MTAIADGGGRLDEVLAVLAESGVTLSCEELLDALWLARRLPPGDQDAPLTQATAPGEPGARRMPSGTRHGLAAPADRATPLEPAAYSGAELHASVAPRSTDGPGAPRTPDTHRALPLRIPDGKALRAELTVGRALRPLKQRRPSLYRRELDEKATAVAMSETGLPDVVLRPAYERWLDLALVVDDGLSMLLWQRLVTELHALLRRAGAFRVVRIHGLRTRGDDVPALHARPFDPAAPPLSPRLLADPTGRTLVLVVSDGMGSAWRDGRMHAALAAWAGNGPTAVVHTLPPRLWDGSGIRADRWHVTARRRGSPNTDWTVTDPVLPPELASFDNVPVPVLEPDAAPLAAWARLVASPGSTEPLPLLSPPVHPTTTPATSDDDVSQVQRFRDAASSEAYRLAAHLAAVAPVSIPVMRLVQAAVPWRADTAHLAEVFLGGLMRPAQAPQAGPLSPQHRVFDFTEPARETLLDTVPTAELLTTSRNIGARLEQLAGCSPDFPAWLAHPAGANRLPIGTRAFAAVGPRLVSHFGAPPLPDQGPVPVWQTSGEHGLKPPWQPLHPHDPRRIGPYTLDACNDSGARLLAYRGRDERGEQAIVRIPWSPGSRNALGLLRTETEALRRMGGRYAPQLLAQALDEDLPWIAQEAILAPDCSPAPRLTDVLARQRMSLDADSVVTLAWQICNAVSLCHLKGMRHGDLSTATILVTGRSVALTGWSSATIDGRSSQRIGNTNVARQEDIRWLGEILRDIGGYHDGWAPSSRWPGPNWQQVRKIIHECFDPDPGARPTARQVADIFARYLPEAHVGEGGTGMPSTMPSPTPPTAPQDSAPTPVAERRDTDPPPTSAPPGGEQPGPLRGLLSRLRFGARREESQRQRRLDLIRAPLPSCHRIAVVGLTKVGRSRTIVLLGQVLATERQERVLAIGIPPSIVPNQRSVADPSTEGPTTPIFGAYPHDYLRISRSAYGLDTTLRYGWQLTDRATNYRDVIDEASSHYSIVLTHAGEGSVGSAARDVFDHCDQLIFVASAWLDGTGNTDADLIIGTHIMNRLIESGYRDLVRRSVGVLIHARSRDRPGYSPGLVRQRLETHCRGVVVVPYDEHLTARKGLDLNRLQAKTRDAYYELAALVAEEFQRPTA